MGCFFGDKLPIKEAAETTGTHQTSSVSRLPAGFVEWTEWRTMFADCVFQAAAAVMIRFQTAKRLVISVRHSGALIR